MTPDDDEETRDVATVFGASIAIVILASTFIACAGMLMGWWQL